MNEINLEEKEYRVMLHALGIKGTKPFKRYSPYPTSHRNYYQIEQCDIWDKLVKIGFATFQINGLDLPYYRVTNIGKKYLKQIGFKWHEE
jgi:hypothetical protein